VKVLAALWLLMPFVGILVAIAIPGYQQYADRAAL
jgi:Tfp pilus assembly protein PilE